MLEEDTGVEVVRVCRAKLRGVREEMAKLMLLEVMLPEETSGTLRWWWRWGSRLCWIEWRLRWLELRPGERGTRL